MSVGNGARLKSKISRLRKLWNSAAEQSVAEAAEKCAAIARENAPVGSGGGADKHLKDSISTSSTLRGGVAEAYATARNPHAVYVEFGTGRRGQAAGAGTGYDPEWAGMDPRPYMQPAAEACRGTFSADAARTLQSAAGGLK